jgi:hypothetical protein
MKNPPIPRKIPQRLPKPGLNRGRVQIAARRVFLLGNEAATADVARYAHQTAHAATENGDTALLNSPHGRLGRLQRRINRAFIALGIAATTRQIAVFCYPREMTRGERLPRWRIRNMARAARSLGARPVKRVGQQWLWLSRRL